MPFLKYWDVSNLNGWAISQKLPIKDLKWVEDVSEFDESFIKSYNKESYEEYFVEADFQYPENFRHNDLSFLPEKMKIEQVENLVANLLDKA